MLNYDGSTKYVWNPYSLMELENILYEENKMQIYLECIATGGSCTAPTSNVFVQQQVNSVFFYWSKYGGGTPPPYITLPFSLFLTSN